MPERMRSLDAVCPNRQRDRMAQEAAARARHDRQRGSPADRGYGAAWRTATRLWRAEDPNRNFCAECRAAGIMRRGPVTDHIVPHKGDPEKFWRVSNWQAMCKPHHDAKTAREEGGFGNLPHPARDSAGSELRDDSGGGDVDNKGLS